MSASVINTQSAERRPLWHRLWAEPAAAKVPNVIVVFWVVKILTTAGGEATSDYLARYGNFIGGGVLVLLFGTGLLLQAGSRRYSAAAYWFLAFAIAVFGTGVADLLHLDIGLSYAAISVLWAVVLAANFLAWHRVEGSLSIHSVTTRRREFFYWVTVFATFALGTAIGDLTSIALGFGYLTSGLLFTALIAVPALAWWKFGLPEVPAFWAAYILTRPLGASFADYIAKPANRSGAGFGEGPTVAVLVLAVAAMVAYLMLRRPDIQHPQAPREPELIAAF